MKDFSYRFWDSWDCKYYYSYEFDELTHFFIKYYSKHERGSATDGYEVSIGIEDHSPLTGISSKYLFVGDYFIVIRKGLNIDGKIKDCFNLGKVYFDEDSKEFRYELHDGKTLKDRVFVSGYFNKNFYKDERAARCFVYVVGSEKEGIDEKRVKLVCGVE